MDKVEENEDVILRIRQVRKPIRTLLADRLRLVYRDRLGMPLAFYLQVCY